MNHIVSPSTPTNTAPRERDGAQPSPPAGVASKPPRSVYCVWPLADAQGAAWWVRADSPREARQLVALNVPEARHAQNATTFGCARDDGELPPDGVICSALREVETVIVMQP